MKKKNLILVISLFVIFIMALSACDSKLPLSSEPPDASGTSAPTTDKVAQLEAQILAIMQSQEISKSEQQQLLNELKAELEALKSTEKPKETSAPIQTDPPTIYNYTLQNGYAVITSVTTTEESITIPAIIDNHQVSAIGSSALNSTTVKSVIISPGIEKIDWFAFSGCISLSSVSIPDSVTSVGYGAFDNTSKALTIHCNRDSFAHKYAQSYGITYDIT